MASEKQHKEIGKFMAHVVSFAIASGLTFKEGRAAMIAAAEVMGRLERNPRLPDKVFSKIAEQIVDKELPG